MKRLIILTILSSIIFANQPDLKFTKFSSKQDPSGRHFPTKEQVRSVKKTVNIKNRILENIDLYSQPSHRIENNGLLVGRVYDQTDNGVSAQVVAIDTMNENQFSTVTNDSGYYSLYVLNSTFKMLALPFDDFHITGYTLDVDVDDDTVEVDIFTPALIFDGDIYGTVTDTGGTPLHAAWVAAVAFSFEEELIFDYLTDINGFYGLDVISLGEQWPYWVLGIYDAEDSDEELVGLVDSIVVNSGDSLEINLVLQAITYDGSIYGEVTYEGEQLSGITVKAENVWTGDYFETYTDEDGYYEMGVTNGEYEVCAYYWVVEDELCEDIYIDSNEVEINFDFEDQPLDGLINYYGNFRFFWTNDGRHFAGQWPVASDAVRQYLSYGGMITLAYEDGNILLGGFIDDHWIPENDGIYTFVENEIEFINRSMTDVGTGITAEQVIASHGYENFTVVLTRIINGSDAELNDVRMGYFMNWDVAYTEGGPEDFAEDDLAGVRTIEVPHPILTVMIPVKISYMMDDDGNNGQSPGYVGFATVPQWLDEPVHISIDMDEDLDDFLAILVQENDDDNEIDPADYATLQMLDLYDFFPGDTAHFTTLILAAETLEGLDNQAELAMQRLFDLTILGINDDNQIPSSFALHQNYPNPFNPTTTIRFDLTEAAHVKLDIYNILGQQVATVVNRHMQPGYHAVHWNGINDTGNSLASGLYIYQITTGNFHAVKKLVLLK